MSRVTQFNNEQERRKQQNKTYTWMAFVVVCLSLSFFISAKFLWGLVVVPMLWRFVNIEWGKENEKINKEIENISG